MKRDKIPSLVIIAGLTTITTIFWVGIGIFGLLRKKEDYKVPEKIIKPINPRLDTETLNRLEISYFLDENQIPETVIVSSPTPTSSPVVRTSPTPSPQASPSASPSVSPTSSPSPT